MTHYHRGDCHKPKREMNKQLTMSSFYSVFYTFFFIILISPSFFSFSAVSASDFPFLHHYDRQQNQTRKFELKTNKFWKFDEQSNAWVEVQLPYDLISCTNDTCTKVGSIGRIGEENREEKAEKKTGEFDDSRREEKDKNQVKADDDVVEENSSEFLLPLRKRISVTKISENSIWITGPSGSIYERFWNGLQWVIEPHDLPVAAGFAISVFIIDQRIFALSEAGKLYQVMLLKE